MTLFRSWWLLHYFCQQKNSFGVNFWTSAWCSSSREKTESPLLNVSWNQWLSDPISLQIFGGGLCCYCGRWSRCYMGPSQFRWSLCLGPKIIPRVLPRGFGGLGHRKKTPCCSSVGLKWVLNSEIRQDLFLLNKPSKNQSQIFWILDGDHLTPQATRQFWLEF